MILDDLSKDTRIQEEKGKLNALLQHLDKDTFESVQSLVNNAAFMAVTLEDLQVIINEKGVTEEYQNGQNQWGYKERTEVKVYNTMIKNYQNNMKQLQSYLELSGVDVSDGFEEFVFSKGA